MVLSCYKNKHLWKKILEKNSDSIIFVGNPNQKHTFILENRILYLKCQDTYECLPEKIILMVRSIYKILPDVTHIFKLDDHDTEYDETLVNKIKTIKNIEKINYGGQLTTVSGSRTYHYGKCSNGSYWEFKKYEGEFPIWADGGSGYLLSRKAMGIIDLVKDLNYVRKNYIYEDVMIGLLLKNHGINVVTLPRLIGSEKGFLYK